MRLGQLENRPRCPDCSALLDGFGGGDRPPEDGDVTCCAYCGQRIRFRGLADGGMGLVAATFEELWAEDPQSAAELERARTWILKRAAERPVYVCRRCGMVSYHPKDLAERYCGACHKFEDEP